MYSFKRLKKAQAQEPNINPPPPPPPHQPGPSILRLKLGHPDHNPNLSAAGHATLLYMPTASASAPPPPPWLGPSFASVSYPPTILAGLHHLSPRRLSSPMPSRRTTILNRRSKGEAGIAPVLLHLPCRFTWYRGRRRMSKQHADNGHWGRELYTKLSSRVAYMKSTSCILSPSILPFTIHVGMPFQALELPGSNLSRQFSASKAESFSER